MALSKIRVLDLSRILAGPYATMLLGDMGASIVKIERPGYGDDTRMWGPPFLPPTPFTTSINKDAAQESTYFLSINRNKKSLALDLSSPAGTRILQSLIPHFDVLIHNYLPSAAEKLKVDYDTVKSLNPEMIYCSISGFGDTGKMKDRGGYDLVSSAMYGLMDITGEASSDVGCKTGVAVTDVMTGVLACSSVCAQLFRREVERNESGDKVAAGAKISASLMETQLSMLTSAASSTLNAPPNAGPTKRLGNAHPSIVPYETFICKGGGAIVVAGMNDKQFKELWRVVGLGGENTTVPDEYSTNPERVQNRIPLIELINKKLSSKTREDWISHFESKNAIFVFGPVRSVTEAFECEQAVSRNMVIDMDHPTIGKIKVVNHPVKHEGVLDGSAFTPPPLIGQHSKEVLMDILGLREDEVEKLERMKVIQCAKVD